MLWILARRFLWVEKQSPLDERVEAPHVLLVDEENCEKPFILLRPTEITHLVQLLEAERKKDGSYWYWINWWLSIRPDRYPFNHFDKMQTMVSTHQQLLTQSAANKVTCTNASSAIFSSHHKLQASPHFKTEQSLTV